MPLIRRLALAAALSGLGFAAPASVDCATYKAEPSPGAVMLMFGPSANTRSFAWQTDESVRASEVRILEGEYGAEDGDAFLRKGVLHTGFCTTVDDPRLNRHKVDIPALHPGTYSYRLGGDGPCVYGRFTVRGNPGRVTIVNMNDAQTKDARRLGLWEKTAVCAARAAGGADRVDFIVSGGDFYDGRFTGVERADGGKTGAYLQWGIAADTATPHFPGVPWVMASGNHDWRLYETCAKAGCQSIDYGNVHVATIPYAGGKLNGKYEKALAWLDADLAAAATRTGIVWTVVAMHWGPYTTGDHGLLEATSEWAERVGALCARRHVDLVLQAHDHAFVKTLPYRWDAAGFTERVDDAAVVNLVPEREDGCDVDPRGTYYVSCGCAGHRVGENARYASDRGTKSYVNRRCKVATGRLAVDSRYGRAGDNASSDNPVQMFGVLDVEGRELHYRFFVAEADGSSALYDRLDVRKRQGPRP